MSNIIVPGTRTGAARPPPPSAAKPGAFAKARSMFTTGNKGPVRPTRSQLGMAPKPEQPVPVQKVGNNGFFTGDNVELDQHGIPWAGQREVNIMWGIYEGNKNAEMILYLCTTLVVGLVAVKFFDVFDLQWWYSLIAIAVVIGWLWYFNKYYARDWMMYTAVGVSALSALGLFLL